MPILTSLKPSSVKHHPFNLTYVFLRLGAALLRYINASRQKKEIKRQLKTLSDDVVRRAIAIPSRELERTIEVHVYEPKERDLSGETNKPLAVHVNFHGFVVVLSHVP